MILACGTEFINLQAAVLFWLPFSWGLTTLPAYLAVKHLLQTRYAAPLGHETLDRWATLGLTSCAACGAVLGIDGFAAAISPADALSLGDVLLLLLAPCPLGAASWAAGELLSGESEHHRLALAASIGATYLATLGACALFADKGWEPLSIPHAGLQLAVTWAVALAGAGAYLVVRGETLAPAPPEAVALQRVLSDYSSSMSENRSLRGSSGFFCGAGCCGVAAGGCAGCGAGLAVCGGAPREGAGASG